jgi:predicted chitinase
MGAQKDTPEASAMRARIAAYALHSQRDSKEVTAPARAGFLARFEREVDPHRVLTEAVRHSAGSALELWRQPHPMVRPDEMRADG